MCLTLKTDFSLLRVIVIALHTELNFSCSNRDTSQSNHVLNKHSSTGASQSNHINAKKEAEAAAQHDVVVDLFTSL